MIRPLALVTLVLAVLTAGRAVAQPADPPDGPDASPPEALPVAPVAAPPPAAEPDGVPWTEFEIAGNVIDDPARLRRMFEAELRARPVLTRAARNELTKFAAALGYQLVDSPQTTTKHGGVQIKLILDPIVVVRWVDISLSQGIFGGLVDDEVRRRLRVRVGTSLPWEPDARQALLNEDSERIRRYLRDEGFFEATVTVKPELVGRYGARVKVNATLGPTYQRGHIEVSNASSGGAELAIPAAEVARTFSQGRCDILRRCRFTYARFLADLDKVTAMFQRRGYPSVRVTHDFDPLTSFDRRTHTVDIQVSVDPRRKLDIVFEGNDKGTFPDDNLSRQLTFAAAGTADDVEVAASAAALERYYQSRGYFDVAVTSERVRLGAFDRVVYRIEPGTVREIKGVRIVCRRAGDPDDVACALPSAELAGAIGTRPTTRSFFGEPVYATSVQLAADVVALVRYYRERGFEQARARVELAPSPAGWAATAVSAAQVLAETSPAALQARFVIEEGPRTTIEAIHVVFEGRAAGRANAGDERRIVERIGIKPGDPYVRDKLDTAAKDVADWYWSFGRPRAKVTVLDPVPGRTASSVVVVFNIEERQELRIGEIVVRGNFRTRDWVVRSELGFRPGEPLTGQLFTAGPRRLRATNLFDAVKLDFIDFEDPRRDTVNVVVRVEERHDVTALLDLELGGSLELTGATDSGIFSRAKPVLPNLFGLGIRLDNAFTYGTQYQSAESTLRLPRWLARRYVHATFDTELGAFVRSQDTERFGALLTAGASLAASRTWERQRTDDHGARLLTAAVRFDVRRRSRDEELVRPPGLAGDLTTNPIVTRTGTVGLTLGWDQRHDVKGNLNPLAPAAGFRVEGGVAYAPSLLGQDTFVKLNGLGQVFMTRGRLQLRLDARYDHGIPLGRAVLLPEVERFFAGGDSTVRGFEEDRLATELIEEAVPPLGETRQVRVLPAGGNIRALSTIDAQVTVWKLGGFPVASALFADAGLVTNTWKTVEARDVRPSAGTAVRWLLPIGAVSLEYAVPIAPRTGDNPRGRLHFAVALRY